MHHHSFHFLSSKFHWARRNVQYIDTAENRITGWKGRHYGKGKQNTDIHHWIFSAGKLVFCEEADGEDDRGFVRSFLRLHTYLLAVIDSLDELGLLVN